MTTPYNNVINFNKERAIPVTETEDIKMRRASWQKLIKEQGLEGFFRNHKAPPPTGIVFEYDTEEVKNNTVLPIDNQKG